MSTPAVPQDLQLPPSQRAQSAFKGEGRGGGGGGGGGRGPGGRGLGLRWRASPLPRSVRSLNAASASPCLILGLVERIIKTGTAAWCYCAVAAGWDGPS